MKLSSFKYLLKEGFKNLWSNRLMTFASVGVLVCCLVIMGSAAVLSVNVSKILGWTDSQNVALFYLAPEATLEEAEDIKAQIDKNGNVTECRLVTKEEGLLTQQEYLGDKELLEALLEDNPLSHSFEVTIKDLAKYEQTINEIKGITDFYSIHDQQDFAKKLTGFRNIIMIAGMWIIALLLIVSLFIIVNTIKLAMYIRKLEISIMKSVGATNMFVRFPFLIEGALIGIIAGLLSLGIVWYAYRSVSGLVFEALEVSVVPFSQLGWQLFGGFVAFGFFVGVVGSLITIRKYLREKRSDIFD